MPTPSPAVIEALRLRRWSLALFGGLPSPPPSTSPGGWHLFLTREACASRLRLAAGDHAPPPLRAAADTDTQHLLLLRAELLTVLKIAGPLGLSPIVLKGGATLLDPARAVRAKDIDLLLDPVGARALLAALDSAGWRTEGGGTGHHFAERFRPGSPPIEVHTTEGGEPVGLGPDAERRAVPHPTLPHARLLAQPDRVRQLAIHQTLQHVAYRGRLRDLLLLSDALPEGGSTPDPADWGLTASEADATREVLGMAGELRQGRTPRDRFEGLAALWYGLDLTAAGRPESAIRRLLSNWVFDFAVGGDALQYRWGRSWDARLEGRTWLGPLQFLERVPAVLRVVRTMARLLWLPPLVGWAWLIARRESAQARAAIASLGDRP